MYKLLLIVIYILLWGGVGGLLSSSAYQIQDNPTAPTDLFSTFYIRAGVLAIAGVICAIISIITVRDYIEEVAVSTQVIRTIIVGIILGIVIFSIVLTFLPHPDNAPLKSLFVRVLFGAFTGFFVQMITNYLTRNILMRNQGGGNRFRYTRHGR